MNEEQGYREMNLEGAKQVVGLKTTSYREYLAARHLLNDGFLHQAAFFINSCIEKQIKALLIALNIPVQIKHDTFKLYNLLQQHKPIITDRLNPDFFRMISKIYKSRYYEDLGTGYNFVIIKNKYLAELDYTFSILEPTIRYQLERDRKVHPTKYEMDKEKKYLVLYRNNYLLNNIEKTDFLNQPDMVYEFRIAPNHEIFEVTYNIPFNKEHNVFLYEGLKPQPDNASFQLSNHHAPISS